MIRKNVRPTEVRNQALQSSIAFQNLGEPVQKLLGTLNAEVSEEDLHLLSTIKVRQLAKVFDMMSSGEDPEDIYLWLKSQVKKNTKISNEPTTQVEEEEEMIVDDEEEEEEAFVMEEEEEEEMLLLDEEEEGFEFEDIDEEEKRKEEEELFEMEPEMDDAPEEEDAEESRITHAQRKALEILADETMDDRAEEEMVEEKEIPDEIEPLKEEPSKRVESPVVSTNVIPSPSKPRSHSMGPIRSDAKLMTEKSPVIPKVKEVKVPSFTIPLPQVNNPQFLKACFAVMKYVPKKLSPKQTRIWVVDHFEKKFLNLAFDGTIRKEHAAHKLLQLEKSSVDARRVRMMFLDASHSYELLFPNASERERFYETASAIRPSIRVYSPSLTNPDKNAENASTTIDGLGNNVVIVKTPTVKGTSVDRELKGICKINASRSITENVLLWIGTINMSGRKPSTLEKWLPLNFDIYVISFIEVDASVEDINKAVTHSLSADYLVLASMRMYDVHIVVSTRKKLVTKLSNVEGSTRRIQTKGSPGTRGAAGIALNIHDTSICFIVVCLAAGAENIEARNSNLRDIASKLILGRKEVDILQQFNHVFLVGNFNYRVEMSPEAAVRLISEKKYTPLLEKCQLNQQCCKEGLLHGFMEPPVNFQPTYRFKKGTLDYNISPGQVPSYTDRILIKSMPNAQISCTSYGINDKLLIGEHLPVSATFSIRALRPCLSCFEKVQKPQVRIIFTHIAVVEYSVMPVMCPLLTIHCPFGDGPYIVKNFGATRGMFVWSLNDLPSIDAVTHIPEYLELQHLLFVIREQNDSTKSPRGTACLGLKGAIINREDMEQEFTIDLTALGKRIGALQVRLMWSARK